MVMLIPHPKAQELEKIMSKLLENKSVDGWICIGCDSLRSLTINAISSLNGMKNSSKPTVPNVITDTKSTVAEQIAVFNAKSAAKPTDKPNVLSGIAVAAPNPVKAVNEYPQVQGNTKTPKTKTKSGKLSRMGNFGKKLHQCVF